MTKEEYVAKRNKKEEIKDRYLSAKKEYELAKKEYELAKKDYGFLKICNGEDSIDWYTRAILHNNEPVAMRRGPKGSTRYEFFSPFEDNHRASYTYRNIARKPPRFSGRMNGYDYLVS